MDRPEGPGSYDVAEFDKSDPDAGLRSILAQLTAATGDEDPHRGDIMDKAESMDLRGRVLFLVLHDDISKMVNAGDVSGALGIAERAAAKGMITPADALFGKWLVYNIAGDAEAELETITEMERRGVSGPPAETKPNLLYRLGRRDELAAWCSAWRDSDGSRVAIYLNRARLMYLMGDTAEALKHADAICILDDYCMPGRELAGDILADMGDLRGAVERYNEVLGRDFHNTDIHIKKAKALMKLGRPDSAALACRRALDVRPQDKRLTKMLAEASR